MAGEKFIRVSVQLPEGVTLATHSKLPGRAPLGPLLHAMGIEWPFTTIETDISTHATGQVTLTLECSEAQRDELIAALEVLRRELRTA